MRCKSCGAEIDSNDRFCRDCGMPVGGGKKANNKEEGYADNIFSKAGRFDANYIVPMAIFIGILMIISGIIKMRNGDTQPSETKTMIETEAKLLSDGSIDIYTFI